MKRPAFALVVTLVSTLVTTTPAAAQSTDNVWACHQAGDRYTVVPPEQVAGHVRHGDPTVVAGDKATAQALCDSLGDAPRSETSGGGSTGGGSTGGGGSSGSTPLGSGGGHSARPAALPRTGLPALLVVLAGAALLASGAALRRP